MTNSAKLDPDYAPNGSRKVCDAFPIDNTPAEFAAYVNVEIAKWAKVVKAAGLRIE